MTLLLKQIFAFFKMLNSDTGHNQLAAGIACGLILGFTPALSLQSLLVFLLAFIFRIQLGAAFLAAFFFAFPAWMLDGVFHDIGMKVLNHEALKPTFTTMFNMPIVPLTRFNNSIVMGSAVVTIIAAPFVFLLARFAIMKYREKIVARFQKSKTWKALSATSLYKWYAKYDQLYGA